MAKSSALTTSNPRVEYTIEIIQNSQNKANRTSNVTVKVRFYRTNTGFTTYGTGTVYCKIDGTEYSAAVSPSQKITEDGIVLFTKTLDIKHASNGKKDLTVSAWIDHNAPLTSSEQSYTQKLTDIPVASTFTVANGTLGTSQKFTVTQSDASFSHEIKFSCGTVKDSVAVSKTTNTAPTWTPPPSLASQNTAGEKVTVTFTMTTYSGDTPIGTNTASAEYTIPATVVPSCSIAVTDPTNYKNTYGAYVQGKSKFQVTITGTPIYSSPISSYKATANGTPYYTSSFTTTEIKDFGSQTISASVTDDRGHTGTNSTTVTVLEYYTPKLNITAERCDADSTPNIEGTNFKIDITYNVAPLGNKNKFSISYKYRKVGEGNFITETLTGSYNTIYDSNITVIVPNIDSDSSYEIEVTITDNFGSETRATKVGSAFTFLHFDGPTSNGIGRNKLNVLDNGFDTGGPIRGVDYSFDNDIYMLIGTGTWGNTSHMITGVTPGDKIRFKTVIMDSGGQVILYMFTENSENQTNIATLSYIDGSTESYFEYTLPSNFQWLFVGFYDNSGTKKDIRFKRPILTVNNDDMTYEQYIIGVPPRLGIGKIAELDNGADFGLKARFNAGFEFPILRQYTDLNTLLTPNFYIGANVTDYQYINCPITGGTFYLEIVGAGINSVRQTITTCSKLHSVSYERFYYDGSWGEWRNCYHSEEVLYNSATGTTGTVTLKYQDGTDPDITKFTYLDIYFMDNNYKDGGCVRITNLSSKVVNISMIEDGNSNTFIRRTAYAVSNKALTPNVSYAGYVAVTGTTVKHTIGTNYIHIVKVVGIR